MNVAVLVQLSILALALYAVMGSCFSTLVLSRLRPRLTDVEPAGRARALVALSALPAASAIALTALCFLPSTLSMLWTGADHCLNHGDGHLHFCLVHPAASSGGSFGWLIAGSLAAGLAVRVVTCFSKMARAHRMLRLLTLGARFDKGLGVWRVESDLPLAMTIGLFRPRIFVSSALVRGLPPGLAAAVIEHERAHVRRRDALRKLVAGLLSLMLLPHTRRGLLADLDLASEQACDEEAGARVGDRLRVAQALLRVERLLHGTRLDVGFMAASFDGRSVAPRVESLLADPTPPAGSIKPLRWLVATIAALAFFAEPLHHHTETVLGLIVR